MGYDLKIYRPINSDERHRANLKVLDEMKRLSSTDPALAEVLKEGGDVYERVLKKKLESVEPLVEMGFDISGNSSNSRFTKPLFGEDFEVYQDGVVTEVDIPKLLALANKFYEDEETWYLRIAAEVLSLVAAGQKVIFRLEA
jgi:hypothetical protein